MLQAAATLAPPTWPASLGWARASSSSSWTRGKARWPCSWPGRSSPVRLATIVGHNWSIFLKFEGGKGVATALGVLAVLVPAAALAGVLAYALLFALFRISSLGSLAAGLAAVAAAAVWPGSRLSVAFTSVLYALILFTHRGNLRRLLGRVETRL